MSRVLHILDESAPEDAVRLASLLLRQLGGAEQTQAAKSGGEQHLAVIGRTPPSLRGPTDGCSCENLMPRAEAGAKSPLRILHIGRRFGLPPASMLDLKRIVERCRPEVIHALDPFSSAVAGALRAAFPATAPALVTTVCDPADAPRIAKWRRALGGRSSGKVICSAERVRRRLVEAGVPGEAATVIRPAVDFGAILAAKRSITRAELGLPAGGRVLLTASQPSRAGGQFYAVWATAILNQIWPDVRLIVPGTSREAERLRRLAARINCPEAYVFTGDRYGPSELLAVADMLIAPALADVSTGWLGWAMAAGVPVTGSAIPCIAEFIADRQNGFLCRVREVHTLATRVRLAFADERLLRKCAEAARGQAYEAFRSVQFAEAYQAAFHEADSTRVGSADPPVIRCPGATSIAPCSTARPG
jgi:glycosyltransferase involved in cell wall biosynthesis